LPYEDDGPSVSGFAVFLEDAPITEKRNIQRCTSLSITEAELVSGSQCAQEMLFAMRVLESIGLLVQKPMLLYIDNSGAVDYANNWSTSGRMRHVGIRLELKEQNLVKVVWVQIRGNACGFVYLESVRAFVQKAHKDILWRR
jgi:hypothetical protein